MIELAVQRAFSRHFVFFLILKVFRDQTLSPLKKIFREKSKTFVVCEDSFRLQCSGEQGQVRRDGRGGRQRGRLSGNTGSYPNTTLHSSFSGLGFRFGVTLCSCESVEGEEGCWGVIG